MDIDEPSPERFHAAGTSLNPHLLEPSTFTSNALIDRFNIIPPLVEQSDDEDDLSAVGNSLEHGSPKSLRSAYQSSQALDQSGDELDESFIGQLDLQNEEAVERSRVEAVLGELDALDFDTDDEDDDPLVPPAPAHIPMNMPNSLDLAGSYRTFSISPPRRSTEAIYNSSHSNVFVRLIILTIAFLHLQFHLPFAACDILLYVLATLLPMFHVLPEGESMPTTLKTVLKRLDLKDRFNVYPSCKGCHKIFVEVVEQTDTFTCPTCHTHIFSSPDPSLVNNLLESLNYRKPKQIKATPKQVVVFRPLSDLVVDFLQRDGAVAKMDAWRFKDRSDPDLMRDMMDGRIWNGILGPDGRPFFGDEGKEEIRIGVTVNLDWCASNLCTFT
jgi:hypothetical protein